MKKFHFGEKTLQLVQEDQRKQLTFLPLLVRKFPSGENVIQFKEESKEKLSLPRDTLYSRTPVSAWTLKSFNLLPGIIPRFYPECYHTDFHLPKPSCVAGVPRGKQIWVFRAPSKTFWCSVSINISKDCRLKFKGFK